MRYRRAPAGGGIRTVAAVRAMSAVMRRAAVRGAVPCRISPAVSFLRLVEYRFFLLIVPFMSFRRSPCRFVISCRILLCCMALCWSGDTGCRVCHSAFVLSHLIVPSHHLITVSYRLIIVSSHRFVLSRHVRRYASLDKGGGKGVSFNYSYGRRFLIPYDFSIRRRYSGISVLPRFPIYHDTLYCVNFLYYDMHIRFRTGSPNRLSGTRS